jgi:hypothetical protein
MPGKANAGKTVVNAHTEMGIPENSPFRRMLNDMSQLAQAEEESSAFMGDSLAAIYNAEDDDAVWDADMTGPFNAQHLAGCELDLYDMRIVYSRGRENGEDINSPWVSQDGKKMYALVTAARISSAGEKRIINLPKVGEQFIFNTSAQFLTAKLFTFWTRGKFGNGATMTAAVQATELGDGKAVLKLVRVPERVIRESPVSVVAPDGYDHDEPAF